MDMADGQGADPADAWVLDPVTGEYRLRLPGEHPYAAAPHAGADHARDAAGPAPARRSRGEVALRSGGGLEHTAELVLVERPAAPAAVPGGRAAARAGNRQARGRGRRRTAGSGGLWIAGSLGVLGLLGCGTGGYLLVHGHGTPPACAAAPSAAPDAGAAPADAGPTLTPGPKAQPIDVRVTVLNGSGVFGQAETALSWMQNKEGFLRTSNGGPAKVTATTTLVYAPDHADQARTLAAAMHLPASALDGTGTATAERDPMVLTLGKDFTEAGKPLAAPAAARTAAPHPASASCSR